MNTVHRWFRSEKYTLLGHIDMPDGAIANIGAIIIPPFGWEEVCSYRPLRFMGQILAARGIPVMRFDLPGTGDSSGGALDSGLVDSCVTSIHHSATELRVATGVEEVAVIGIRFGALLALLAARRKYKIQDLVLWGPSANGRAVLREWRAFARMERREYATGDVSPAQPSPGFEVGGFLLSPETERDIERIDLSALEGIAPRRVLMLSRDEVPADPVLADALTHCGCKVESEPGYGYAAMMTLPHEAISPAATSHVIADFLASRDRFRKSPLSATQAPSPVFKANGVSETIFQTDCGEKTMFGVLAEPDPRRSCYEKGILLLNAGSVRHTGPNRMWVETARRWALKGLPSLRLDLPGIGESNGVQNLDIPSLYQRELVDQVEAAQNTLRDRLGITHFAAIGLCAGAFWAFHLGLRRQDLKSAILLNPRLLFWDSEADRRRVLRRALRWSDWLRVLRGDLTRDTLRRATDLVLHGYGEAASAPSVRAAPETTPLALQALERSQTRLTFVFTEGEPLLRELESAEHIPFPATSCFRCERIANAGHTFRPLWSQKLVQEILDRELNSFCGTAAPLATKAS